MVPVSDQTGAQAIPQPTVLVAVEGATEVLLIRHGRSADLAPGVIGPVDPPLPEEGVAQVAALARRLRSKELDAVSASNTRRTIDTALALAEPRGLPVVQVEDLQEVRLGDWGGSEFRRRAAVRDPEFLVFARSSRWDDIPSGEGDASLRSRVVHAVDAIAARHRTKCIAVVVHAGVINAYLAEKLGMHRSFFVNIENTSATVVHVGDDA
jgi:broad specificity phosphatase PhoE